MTVGDRIRYIREQRDMSQDDLAKLCGYSNRSAISKIEGSGDNVTQKKIVKCATALGVTPAYLMGWLDVEDVTDYIINHPDQYGNQGEFLAEREKADSFYKKYLNCPEHIKKTIDDLLKMGGESNED